MPIEVKILGYVSFQKLKKPEHALIKYVPINSVIPIFNWQLYNKDLNNQHAPYLLHRKKIHYRYYSPSKRFIILFGKILVIYMCTNVVLNTAKYLQKINNTPPRNHFFENYINTDQRYNNNILKQLKQFKKKNGGVYGK